jgi:molybdopterin-guanine dinucleotide biosynthesis protein A
MTPGDARPVVGVVLAGGRARRMGGKDKSVLLLDGQPLLDRAIARLAPQVATLVVSANGPPGQFDHLGVSVIADTISGFAGPLAGFLAGMAWARANVPGASHVVTVAVDTPFFPLDLVARLSPAGRDDGVAAAGSGGRIHPVFALVPVGLANDLAAFLAAGESLKVADWLARHDVVTVEFDGVAGVDPFFNINTPDDLAQAEAIIHRLRQSVS